MKKISDCIKSHFKSLSFCAHTSLKASILLTVLRLALETFISLLPLASMYVSKKIINNLAYNAESYSSETYFLILLSASFILIGSFLGNIKNYISTCHNEKIDLIINQNKINKSASIDISYFDSSEYYNEFSNASANASSIPATVFSLFHFIGMLIKSIGLFIVFCKYSLLLALLMVLMSIPFALIEIYYNKKYLDNQKKLMPLSRRMGYISSIFTTKPYAMDLRTYNCKDYLYEKFFGDWNLKFAETKKLLKEHLTRSFLLSNMPQLIVVFTTIFLASRVTTGQLLIGDYTYITGTSQQLLGSVLLLISSLSKYKDNINRSKQFIDFMDIKPSIVDAGTCTLNYNENHVVEFKNVSFKYPQTENVILNDVSFSFQTNDIIAFVGENGAGKTTIVKLILRLYDVDSGEILVDGLNIKNYKIEDIRNLFSVMQQNYNNYSFTLKDNVTLSSINDRADETRVIKALNNANAQNVLAKVGGLQSFLTRIYSEDGVELSGGEWQKVALSRCFFKESKMLIMDEPSAAIDAKSENELFANIFSNSDKCGLILISHRLSNVKNSNCIFVLSSNTIVESGTHEELMNIKGLYYNMYSVQLQKYL